MSRLVQEYGVPNLDAHSIDELWEFWQATNSVRPIKHARRIFSERPRPEGYVRVTKDLGCYASNRATAMRLRMEGNIATAMQYERICDGIYDRLPEWARW